MEPDGIGSLYLAFEQLKERLYNAGYFDDERKKQIPLLPGEIDVATSPTGAVIRDIINVSCRRFPNTRLKLLPVQVQGEQAAGQIAKAIDIFNELNCVDVIIIARGGGSLEELWAFNEEIVARSIFRSRIPVVSAVGHETDFTIADFVADVRAPTPSAAAEIVIPEKNYLKDNIKNYEMRLRNLIIKLITSKKMELEKLMADPVFRQPYNKVFEERMRIENLNKYLHKALISNTVSSRSRLALLIGKLDVLSPLSVLARGYGIVRKQDDKKIVKSIRDICKDGKIEVDISDGKLRCTVDETEERCIYEGKTQEL
jgi:exodeoxyribonuclease VII large subunit